MMMTQIRHRCLFHIRRHANQTKLNCVATPETPPPCPETSAHATHPLATLETWRHWRRRHGSLLTSCPGAMYTLPCRRPCAKGRMLSSLSKDACRRMAEEKNSKCWQWNRRKACLEALWRLTAGEERILGRSIPFWTTAGLSYAMAVMDMVDGRTDGRNEDVACVVVLLDPHECGRS